MDFKVPPKLRQLLPGLMIMVIALVILLPQIYTKFVPVGSDITFHYNRFYDIYQQLETGKFNYYQSIYGFNSSGRIINALYGYDMAFFHGVLLWMTKSWLKMQLISSFSCLVIAGSGMYVLMRKLNIMTIFSLVGAAMYMSASPVMYYIRALGFSGWGSAVLPWIFIPAIRVIQNKNKPINPVYLGLTMSIIMNTHMLSAVLAVLAIIPFFLIGFIQTHQKKQFIIDLILSILLFVVLSLNTLVAYADVFLSNSILQPFIPKVFLDNTMTLSITDNYNNTNLGLLFGCMFVFQIVYTVLNWKQSSLVEKLMVSIGSVFLFISSSLMPWDILVKHISALTIFQFAFRFAAISYILLLASLMLTFNHFYRTSSHQKEKIFMTVILTLGILVISGANTVSNKNAKKWYDDPVSMGNNKKNMLEHNPDVIRQKLRSSDLTQVFDLIAKGTPDYLPIHDEYDSSYVYKHFSPYPTYLNEIFHNQAGYNHEVLPDGRLKVTWNTSKGDVSRQVPVIIYGHSTVELNGEKVTRQDYHTSEIGSLVISSIPGENEVIIGYKPWINMTIVLVIKIIGYLFVLVYVIFDIRRIIRDKKLHQSQTYKRKRKYHKQSS